VCADFNLLPLHEGENVMNREFSKIVEHLKWLIFWIGHCRDQAEAKMNEVNQLLGQLGKAGLVHQTVVLGEVIHHCYYSPQPEGHDSSQLVQAALSLPVGIGVVLWDSEKYSELREDPETLESEAPLRFVPFERCEVALKALLLPHIEPLIQQLTRRLP
jgi:hypothetical protein